MAAGKQKEADERGRLEEVGYADYLGPSRYDDGLMIGHEQLHRRFTTDLWTEAKPSRFVNTDWRAELHPAAMDIDDDVVAMLWYA